MRGMLSESRGAAGGPVRLFREVVSELRKVVWPSRQEATRLTLLVIAIAVAIGFFLGLIDLLFNQTLNRLILGG